MLRLMVTLLSILLLCHASIAASPAPKACTESDLQQASQDLLLRLSCTHSFNFYDCAKLLAQHSKTPMALGGIGAAIGVTLPVTSNLPTIDLSTSDPSRLERDKAFREFLKKLDPKQAKPVSFEELTAIGRSKKVIVLGGYSGQGYDDPVALKNYIREIVKNSGSDSLFVIGGTEDGIGQAYKWIPEIAKELNLSDVKTAGIVSRNAYKYGIAKQDYVVFVDTPVDDWEVKQAGRSLMVKAAEGTGGQMIYFKGGLVSEHEIVEGVSHHVPATLVNSSEIKVDHVAELKRILRAHPNLTADSPEAKELLFKATQKAEEVAKEIVEASSKSGTLDVVATNSRLKNILANNIASRFVRAMLSDSSRQLLKEQIAKRGARALALGAASFGVGVAVETLTNVSPTACDDLAANYIDEDKDCRPILDYTPKLVEFLAKSPADQMAENRKSGGALCAVLTQTNQNLRLPMKDIVCNEHGGFSANRGFSVEVANGHITRINGMPHRKFSTDIQSIDFNPDGTARYLCVSGPRGESCQNKIMVNKDRPENFEIDLPGSSGRIEAEARAVRGAVRFASIEVFKVMSCCQYAENSRPDDCSQFDFRKSGARGGVQEPPASIR